MKNIRLLLQLAVIGVKIVAGHWAEYQDVGTATHIIIGNTSPLISQA